MFGEFLGFVFGVEEVAIPCRFGVRGMTRGTVFDSSGSKVSVCIREHVGNGSTMVPLVQPRTTGLCYQ